MERIILIGNYPPDKQESMERFAQMLDAGFYRAGVYSEIWRPKVYFGKWAASTNSGLGKWLGYIDKWIIFPFVLLNCQRKKTRRMPNVRFHVCDHSNSPYLKYLPAGRKGITCHDVLAIRGALGHADAACPASPFGKILQKWILANLQKAEVLATVSDLTLRQLKELSVNSNSDQNKWRTIHNAFNAEFNPLETTEMRSRLAKVGLNLKTPFILHVGSGIPRKNRKLLLDMVAALGSSWHGQICFAGHAPDTDLLAYAITLGLQKRIVAVLKPDHDTLVALYSACEAFIFPSLSEGFGWPVIEAQACGAPVIASNVEPMPEVSGGAALHIDPTNRVGYANAFLSLNDDRYRNQLIRQGYKNALRFNVANMINSYLDLYGIKKPNTKDHAA